MSIVEKKKNLVLFHAISITCSKLQANTIHMIINVRSSIYVALYFTFFFNYFSLCSQW